MRYHRSRTTVVWSALKKKKKKGEQKRAAHTRILSASQRSYTLVRSSLEIFLKNLQMSLGRFDRCLHLSLLSRRSPQAISSLFSSSLINYRDVRSLHAYAKAFRISQPERICCPSTTSPISTSSSCPLSAPCLAFADISRSVTLSPSHFVPGSGRLMRR